MAGRVWLFTRKYPPAIGGMETLSYELTTGLTARLPTRLVALRRSQRWLPWYLVVAAAALLGGLARRDVRLVHLGDPVLAPIGWLASLRGVKVVVTVHGLDVVWTNRCYRWMLRTFARDFASYVCISDAARAAARAAGFDPRRLVTIPVGVRRPAATSSSPGIGSARPLCARGPMPSSGPRLLHVGRLVRRKGLAWFVAEVLPALRRRFPGLSLTVVGSGPDERAVRSAMTVAGVADAVVLLGQVDETTKWRLLDEADICVMPNVAVPGDIEGFGIAALEAGLAGRALVASRLEGLVDAVRDGISGVLVEPGAASAWIEALVRLLEDPKARERLGSSAQAHVQCNHSWDAICDAYAALFEGLDAPRP